MTSLEKRIQDELIKRFNANSWNTITLNMKAGGTMTITPESDVRKIHDAKAIDLYDISTHINGIDATFTDFAFSMEHLANIVADFEENAQHTKETINDINIYYETYIKGHTPEELEIGNKILKNLHNLYGNVTKALTDKHKIETAIKMVNIDDLEYGRQSL